MGMKSAFGQAGKSVERPANKNVKNMCKPVDKLSRKVTLYARSGKRSNETTQTMSKQNTTSASQKNREQLEAWFKKSQYQDVKFWIPPSVLASRDECVAEVHTALTKFEADKAKKPANAEVRL